MDKKFFISMAFSPVAIAIFYASTLFAQVDGQLKTDADKVGSDLDAAIATKQAAFKLANGRHFQILPQPAIPPVDGVKTAPNTTAKGDASTVSFSDQSISVPATVPCSMAIDNYTGPLGQGYVIRLTLVKDGKTYMKAINNGPETRMTHDWLEIRPIPADSK